MNGRLGEAGKFVGPDEAAIQLIDGKIELPGNEHIPITLIKTKILHASAGMMFGSCELSGTKGFVVHEVYAAGLFCPTLRALSRDGGIATVIAEHGEEITFSPAVGKVAWPTAGKLHTFAAIHCMKREHPVGRLNRGNGRPCWMKALSFESRHQRRRRIAFEHLEGLCHEPGRLLFNGVLTLLAGFSRLVKTKTNCSEQNESTRSHGDKSSTLPVPLFTEPEG